MCISVLILTLNEEVNLPACLESVAWSDDIVVFDSYSSDRTVEIARAAGVRVIQRVFDGYASQRNAALREVDYKYPWLLMVDADERCDRELYEEMAQAIGSDVNGEVCVFCFTRRNFFMGRWLKHGLGSSTWVGRLVRLGHVTVSREVNEEYQTNGTKGYLRGQFLHYPFNKGIAFWFERHNRYSSMEACALMQERGHALRFRDLVSSDRVVRRRFLKQVAYRLPCRPFLIFCHLYFVRLGFLDGIAGLTYCRLRMMYEYMIDFKIRELRRRKEGLPV